MNVDVTTALIGAVAAVASALVAYRAKVALDRRRAQRHRQEQADQVMREDTGRVLARVVDGSTEDRKEALRALYHGLELWKEEARRARDEARMWENRAQEWAQAAEQNRLEYEAMKKALEEEQRRTSQLEKKVAKLDRKLAERDQQFRELRDKYLRDYSLKSSTPAPPPDDDPAERETPKLGTRTGGDDHGG